MIIGTNLVDIKGFTFNISNIILVTPISDVQNVPQFIQKQFRVFLSHGVTLLISQSVTLEISKENPDDLEINLLHDKLSYRSGRYDTFLNEGDGSTILDKVEVIVLRK